MDRSVSRLDACFLSRAAAQFRDNCGQSIRRNRRFDFVEPISLASAYDELHGLWRFFFSVPRSRNSQKAHEVGSGIDFPSVFR
ncbi:MAG: hypothetical protein H7Z14_06410 [Anaerolineae bacterium]|nr:hypothetical protein [Phycisphaerae bacterium]